MDLFQGPFNSYLVSSEALQLELDNINNGDYSNTLIEAISITLYSDRISMNVPSWPVVPLSFLSFFSHKTPVPQSCDQKLNKN